MFLHKEVSNLRDSLLASCGIDPDNLSSNMSVYQLDLKHLLSLKQFEMALFALHRPYMQTQSSSYIETVNAALRHLDLQYAIFEAIPLLQRRAHENPFYTIDISIFMNGLSDERVLAGTQSRELHRKLTFQAIERLNAIKRLDPAAGSRVQTLRYFYQKFSEQGDPPFRDVWSANLSDSADFLDFGASVGASAFLQHFPEPFSCPINGRYLEQLMEYPEPERTLRDFSMDQSNTDMAVFSSAQYLHNL